MDYLSDPINKHVEHGVAIQHILPRTGRRGLTGSMTLLGSGAVAGTGTTHRTYIWKARGGYIVSTSRVTIWEGDRDEYDAVRCSTPEEVWNVLSGAYGLTRDGEDAIREAARHDPALQAVIVEEA